MANSVDPDQSAPSVLSGFELFAQNCLSENLGSLRYCMSYTRKVPVNMFPFLKF